MSAALMVWVELSLDTEHVFVVPRIMQREYGRVSKHIEFLGQFTDAPYAPDFLPMVPVLLNWVFGPVSSFLEERIGLHFKVPSDSCIETMQGLHKCRYKNQNYGNQNYRTWPMACSKSRRRRGGCALLRTTRRRSSLSHLPYYVKLSTVLWVLVNLNGCAQNFHGKRMVSLFEF